MFEARTDNGGDLNLASGGDSSRSPSWSSDGESLVFSDTENDRLKVYDLTLGTTTNLPGTDAVRLPAWSPDGNSIAARSGTDLLLYDVDSQKSSVLLENAKYNYIFWS